jgi:hypothetical protein
MTIIETLDSVDIQIKQSLSPTELFDSEALNAIQNKFDELLAEDKILKNIINY